jgi:hypothetical protein
MSKTGKAILAISGIALMLLLGRLWFGHEDSSSVRYHLSQIRALDKMAWRAPSKLRDYFSPSVWGWYVHGRPSFQEHQARIEKHRQALVKLGYYKEREFILQRRVLDLSTASEVRSFFTNAAFSDNHWKITVSDSSITVTASTNDLPLWAQVVSRFDSNGKH